MPKFKIEVNNYNLAPAYASKIWAGSAFAFIDPGETEAGLQTGLANFYGLPAKAPRRSLSLLPDGQVFPGFTVQPKSGPLKLAPVLLTDKEIYRAGQDNVRLLVVAPKWLAIAQTARLIVENNGVNFRTQNVTLNEGGLTLVELGKLPEGGYRVYWDSAEAADHKGEKAECRFSSVEYVLSPLQATLLAHELKDKRLACRLKVERYNEPLNEPVQIELWSGSEQLGQQKVKPGTPGIFNAEFRLKTEAAERLELRVSHLDQLATVVIPGSRKAEREETLLAGLGREVKASLMPGEGTREVRGLYLNDDGMVKNTPVTLSEAAPESRKTTLRWQVAAQAARVLVLDMSGKVTLDRDLGEVAAGQEIEVDVPAPGGFLAVGGWLGERAWEGWSMLLAPSNAKLEITAPATARPGKEIELKLATNSPASVYVLVRDSRLAGAGPQERLAASLKRGLEGANEWATLGYVNQKLEDHPDWPAPYPPPPPAYPAQYYSQPVGMPMPASFAPPPTGAAPAGGIRRFSTGALQPHMQAMAASADFAVAEERSTTRVRGITLRKGEGEMEAVAQQAKTEPRKDFADVAFCAVVQTDALGQVTVSLKLPDAITSYSIEAFALSQDGAEWCAARESLEVSQPVWAELKLPAFVYPGDHSPATLELGCTGGQFRLRLLCDGKPLTFSISGATKTGPDTFSGHRAKVAFEAQPGQWRSELEDLASGEQDVSERTVEAIGQFKTLARRFQLLMAGETLSRSAAGAVQFRLLPSLDKPFNVLCDATASYGHRCCEQTAAKLIAAVAALMAGGDQHKLKDVIVAGVAREKKMYLPGRGFMMYPPDESGGNTAPNDYWGRKAAEHLSSLALIGQPLFTAGNPSASFDPAITQALREAVEMGQNAATAYNLELTPKQIHSGHDAYRAVAGGSSAWNEGMEYARKTLSNFAGGSANLSRGAVLNREEQAYCAAAIFAGGDQANYGLAIGAANHLASSLDGDGRLYSTVDSAALISLMAALRGAGIGVGGQGGSRVRLDGREMPLDEALEIAAAGQSEEVTVLEGAALGELTTEIREDWNAFRAEVPVGIQLNRVNKQLLPRATRVGDNLELVVKVEQYEPGLLVHVCLPPALSKIEGGGEVKKFSADFCGRNEVRIPLRATGYTLPAGEHWAILVRNMFKEEQAGNPGVQLVKVSAD